MLSLYFNCRITGKPYDAPYNSSNFMFYPVDYPKQSYLEKATQYSVLFKTIQSYAVIKFNVAVFNIQFDFIDDSIKDSISSFIKSNYSANKIIINFARPSNLEEWKKDVNELEKLVNKNDPLLVAMNHDIPFIDYTSYAFEHTVNQVFKNTDNNFRKGLLYAFAPQELDFFYNGSDDEYQKGISQREVYASSLSSIIVISVETLQFWLSNALCCDSAYIGRLIDWPGISYRPFTLLLNRFPREFFKHYDGYGHVTGIRLISDLRESDSISLHFPKKNDGNEIILFYYQRWLDNYLLFIRDLLKENIFLSDREAFCKAIEKSLKLFKLGYLDSDVAAGLIYENEIEAIESALRSHIYYSGNNLFQALIIDLQLIKGNKIIELKRVIRAVLKQVMPYPILKHYRRLFKRGI